MFIMVLVLLVMFAKLPGYKQINGHYEVVVGSNKLILLLNMLTLLFYEYTIDRLSLFE